MHPEQMGCMAPFLFVFIFFESVIVQLREIQKLGQGHVKRKGNLVQGFDSGILGKTANDVVQSGLLDVTHGSQLVNGDASFLTELPDAANIEI